MSVPADQLARILTRLERQLRAARSTKETSSAALTPFAFFVLQAVGAVDTLDSLGLVDADHVIDWYKQLDDLGFKKESKMGGGQALSMRHKPVTELGVDESIVSTRVANVEMNGSSGTKVVTVERWERSVVIRWVTPLLMPTTRGEQWDHPGQWLWEVQGMDGRHFDVRAAHSPAMPFWHGMLVARSSEVAINSEDAVRVRIASPTDGEFVTIPL